jgi:hypothetical protein
VFSKKRRDCEMHTTTVNGEPGVVFTITLDDEFWRR